LVDASVSVEVLIDDEPRAMEDASDGLGRLQSVENASDLAQPIYQYGFRGVTRGKGVGRNGNCEHMTRG
jgi:hypothetical protein